MPGRRRRRESEARESDAKQAFLECGVTAF